MTKAEKEILDYTVKYEKRVLKQLEKVYKEALDNIDEKVLELIARKDANEDYVVYQAEFQEMLREQIQASLDMLHSKEYTTVNDYLVDCYNTGFTSAMYNIQAQGIPLMIPISQEDIVRAVTNDTKLSEGLYNSLGKNIKTLKKQITQTLSVGIATSQSYSDISRNLSNVAQVNRNKTMRIARTEGHRIQQASNYNACKKAYSKGANIVKQWSSTLDTRTRDSHRQVDGEIRELDEYFSNGLLIPGDKDAPACEVVNCRCTISQRAKWRLDEKELTRLKERAEYYGIDKTENFIDYKVKYVEISDEVRKIQNDIRLLEADLESLRGESRQLVELLNNKKKYKIDRDVTLTRLKELNGLVAEKGKILNIAREKLSKLFIDERKTTLGQLKRTKIIHIQPQKYNTPLSEEAIIERIAGGDETEGSCASIALAYIGNKQGYNVLDFRDGESRLWFSSRINKLNLFKELNVDILECTRFRDPSKNGEEILKLMKEDRQYYFINGLHATIVKKSTNNVPQYLELQSSIMNGWKDFNNDVKETLNVRFGCEDASNYSGAYLIDIEQFNGKSKFIDALGYINTAEYEQKKGKCGDVK